jgi:hypothetical protein
MEHFEFAFGAVAPANVLEDEDVAIGNHIGIAIQQSASAFIRTGDAIGCAVHEHGQGLVSRAWRVDFCVKFHCVAHGDHHFGFVEQSGVVDGLLLGGTEAGRKEKRCCNYNEKNKKEPVHRASFLAWREDEERSFATMQGAFVWQLGSRTGRCRILQKLLACAFLSVTNP